MYRLFRRAVSRIHLAKWQGQQNARIGANVSGTPSTSQPTSATGTTVTFGVLGPLEVRLGARLLEVSGPQERALLALLLTAPGRVFSVSAIVAGIWGDTPPGHAENTVQSYVSRLRRAMAGDGASLVLTRRPGYLVAVDAQCVDSGRFRVMAAIGRRDLKAGRPGAAATELREALALWRGEAYAEFDAPFAIAERTALEELRLAAVEDRVAADLALGAGSELVAELETLVDQHPWREKLWGQLMTALYRSGRQGDALAAFRRVRKALVDELGLEPGPELRAVEAKILAQDADLLTVVETPSSLPPELTTVGPTFVGREAELARLLAAYDRAAAGSVERVLLTGPHGIGKTRLLAELGREAEARGALVRARITHERSGVPLVILLDDLHRKPLVELTALKELVLAARPPLLVVGAGVFDQAAEHRATISKTFTEELVVPPLRSNDVTEIVRLYVSSVQVEDGVAIAASAAGVPLQIHAIASRYGEELAAAEVERAAAGIPGPRRHASDAQERVAEGIRDRQRIRLVRSAHEPVELPMVVCPYKGLMFFDVDDAPYFFGREHLVAQLVAKLVGARFLSVVGASGSGKSSVVRAGLVAALRAGMLPGSDRWRTVLTTPTQPFPDLADTGARTVLVVDQFEELFTALAPAQQNGYADWLAGAAVRDNVTVVVVVRSDYYAQAAAYTRLADLLAANTVLVGEMSPDELRQAVELPAAAAGLEPDPGMAQTIANDVVGEPGGLPLMSTALLSVWEQRDGRRLTLAAYHEIGGVRTAVARLAEAAYGQLTANQQTVARRILLRLAETGDTGEPVRRRAPMGEVAPDGDADARTVLDTLTARRLLTVSDAHAEVAHEALLREWPRLLTWLDEDEAGRKLRRHLAPAAHDWQARGRDASELYRGPRLAAALDWQRDHPHELTQIERDYLRTSHDAAEAEALRRRRSIRRLRVLAVGLAAVLVLALVAGALFVNQRNRADVRALQAAALAEDHWDRALLYAAQAQRFDASAESRAALLEAVQRGPEATAMFTAGHALHSLVVGADGRRIVAGGSNGAVFVFDTETRQVQQVPGVTAFEADQIDLSPDGRYVAAMSVPLVEHSQGGLPWQLAVVDLEQTPPGVRYLPGHETRGGPRFTADSRTIIDVHGDGVVHYLDIATGEVRRTLALEPFADDDDFIALNGPENRRFVVAEALRHGSVVAWDVDTGRQIWSATEEDPLEATISPDGSQIVVAHADGRIEQINVRTGASTSASPSLAEGLIDVTWAPNGKTFAGATQDRTVLVWNAETLAVDAVLRGHWGELSQLAYSPDGTTLYAAGFDQSVLAWDLTGDRGAVTEFGPMPTAGVSTTALAADGSAVAIGYENDEGAWVEISEIPGGAAFTVDVPVWPLNGWWLVPDRLGRSFLLVLREFASIDDPRHMWIYTIDMQRRELLPERVELIYRNGGDATLTWDNDAILAAGHREVGQWHLDSRPLNPHLYEAEATVGWLAVGSDGRWAALSEDGGTIEIIDLRTGELLKRLTHYENISPTVVFSPDGRWLGTATVSGRVMVWDTRTWEQHTMWEAVPGFSLATISMVFTPNSDFLVTGGAGEAAIWNVEQGASGGARLEVDPTRRDAQVLVAVRDDGTLITFTEGTGVRRWDVSPEGLLEHACALVGRNLTQEEWSDILPHRPYERTCLSIPTGD
jgi:DNA-binding SARP family transcriptional activator/WD40 repeat protein